MSFVCASAIVFLAGYSSGLPHNAFLRNCATLELQDKIPERRVTNITMKSAVIYARYSSERQTEQSIEGQLRICNEFAKQNDLEIVDTYIDRAMTGTNDNRPAFQKMLKDAEISGLWQIVLVYAIDRFGRNSIEVAVNKQKLKKNKKNFDFRHAAYKRKHRRLKKSRRHYP